LEIIGKRFHGAFLPFAADPPAPADALSSRLLLEVDVLHEHQFAVVVPDDVTTAQTVARLIEVVV
jgi:hypothetical protein